MVFDSESKVWSICQNVITVNEKKTHRFHTCTLQPTVCECNDFPLMYDIYTHAFSSFNSDTVQVNKYFCSFYLLLLANAQ